MTAHSKPIPLKLVTITDSYWSAYQKLIQDTVIPYQWEALNDRIQGAEPSHAIRNFRIAAGLEQGEFGGMVFQDSDLAKWLEAVGFSLAIRPDAKLERLADEAIALVGMAQGEDGYFNTYFTVKEPGNRWTNLQDCHELYVAGHFMEAAVAYYYGTGKRSLLDIMCRFADYIDSVFGPLPGQLRGYDGHQEIELALVKLYGATGEERYLRLSQFFIDERGQEPNFLLNEWSARGGVSHWTGRVTPKPDMAYNQAHVPVREQAAAVGHAVRAVYMYAAMADLALHTGDEPLLEACRRLWTNTVTKQMYITGGIGTTHLGEAFTFDYDLPNNSVYAETCASIGLIFFAQRMLSLEANGAYADVLERALYNNVVGSMSCDGKHFFYVNPLEVWPEASQRNPDLHHVKAERQAWFGCSCCPPNVARLLASLGEYIYTAGTDTLYTHLYIGSEAIVELAGQSVSLRQETRYPWDGEVTFTLELAEAAAFTLALRIPGWCDGAVIFVNGQPAEGVRVKKGYAYVSRTWRSGDNVSLTLPMAVKLMEANPNVRSNAGKGALQRGPLVYCLEEKDNGSRLASISISPEAVFDAKFDSELPGGGGIVLEGVGVKDGEESWRGELYRPLRREAGRIPLKAIPYSLWGNRGSGEMAVWLRLSN
ncbi:glycoside hydrolase family 127 protein [Paenibacillus sp. R14(2021)]|uniref:glycoside hydrolase family 127 protein n=1 Tax=Paenibacillus sp. R14(2021) TaxID=2859228 RepID=UPI001C6153ED|nr:beta-L-arabinofuranosidase domain-containing protein [Paenibacillus sp. R14(2021)]